MKKWQKILLYTAGVLVLLVVGVLFLHFEIPVVSVKAETLWHVGSFPITNALLTSWIVTLFLIVVAILGTRNMQLVPSGLQNVLEAIFEALYNLTESVAGPKWVKKFYLVPVTIFIYVLISNWFGLIPGLAGFGLCEPHHVEGAHAEAVASSIIGCEPGEVIVPLFRSPSADLNDTLMLAIFTQIMAQVFGFMALGVGGYLGKFFVFDGIIAAFRPDEHGQRRGCLGMFVQFAMGVIDAFVGLLEFVSEFVKVIAFTFRLFGNIFSGEVMLIILTFLVPLILTLPFLGLEVFVGLIQAFIFYILSVAFYTVAVTSHDHEEAH
ncbi:MAG: F0F1 ATP synthase subunit A [Caldilineae bacterium]|nr:MAG: F0F1 ATP synthase subunit A [Caldilineae bacterium]